jgi:enamine deaminase RidA (YjgF/YER057c/UK114 family)
MFCSGQIALRPDGTLNEGDIREQTTQVMDNLAAVLRAAGSELDKGHRPKIRLVRLDQRVKQFGTQSEHRNRTPQAYSEIHTQ